VGIAGPVNGPIVMSKQFLFSSIFVVLAILLVDVPAHAQAQLTQGQIADKVVCAGDTTQSYALYLPSNYTTEKRWPILYAFDPAARGRLPVEHFREAAEKYGWIVVGSNNSRNGPWSPVLDAWRAITKDTHARFSIDDERIYLAGFSGGARVAVQFANLCHDCVTGVIGCGAGFPAGVTPSATMRFVFVGTVGVDDFNFPEVKGLDEAMTKAGMMHHVQVFSGRHEWAPANVALEAVEWLELQAMKAGKRPREPALIESIWKSRLQQSKTLEAAKRLFEAYQSYGGMAETFRGLRDTSELEPKLSQLKESREVKSAIRDEQQQIKKQLQIQDQINALFAARNRRRESDGGNGDLIGSPRQNNSDAPFDYANRLQAALADLRKQSKAAEDTSDRRVARRALEGLFVGLFEKGLDMVGKQDLRSEAVETFQSATEVLPDRPGAFFYLAWAHAANGDKKKSLQALKAAVEKGFSGLAAITENKAFDSIRSDPQYQQIILRLKKTD